MFANGKKILKESAASRKLPEGAVIQPQQVTGDEYYYPSSVIPGQESMLSISLA